MTKRRFTDKEYAAMAADYAANPPTADEVLSIEVNPAYLRMVLPRKGTNSNPALQGPRHERLR